MIVILDSTLPRREYASEPSNFGDSSGSGWMTASGCESPFLVHRTDMIILIGHGFQAATRGQQGDVVSHVAGQRIRKNTS